ncbi:MAG TPA: phosphatase PAP2 family protein [Bryobacteraceae bacterium]|jgi:acid phosphatase (class A)|nr:phosphatase PAP2 family protein [Bryobacteraceae bacterium]
MNRKAIILLFSTGVVLAAQGDQPPPTAPNLTKAVIIKRLKFLTPEQLDPGRLLPPSVKDGSDSQLQDLAIAEKIVKKRSPQRYAQAKWDNEHEDPSAFAATIGPEFNLSKLPATAKLLDEAMNEQWVAASLAKEYFHRKFPVAHEPANVDYHAWSCDDDVKKPADRPYRSYPSGHATMGYSIGIILADLMPEKSQAILARAKDYAYSRQVCGDHYRSDVEASHALGSAVGIMLLNNAALQADIQAAKAELRAAHLTGD